MSPTDWFSISIALWAIRFGARPAIYALRRACDVLLAEK